MKSAALLALAAATAAGVSTLAVPAEANGVRLHFGGPLGSFVARPTEGYAAAHGARNHAAPSHHGHGAERARSRAVTAWTPPRKPAAAKPRPRDDDESDARQAKQKVAAAARRARSGESKDDDATPRSSNVKQIATNSVPIVSSVAPSEPKPASVTETSPLPAPTAGTLKLDATAAPVEAREEAATRNAALAPAGAVHHVQPQVVNTEEPKPAAAEIKAETDTKSETKAEKRSDKKGDCRRFIPFVGVTISVRCSD